MKQVFWVKWSLLNSPEKYVFDRLDEFLDKIVEDAMDSRRGMLQWIIRE